MGPIENESDSVASTDSYENLSEPSTPIKEEARIAELSEELLTKAKEELNETIEVREKAFEVMKEWLQAQENKYENLDDVSLLWFLRGCKYNTERTIHRIENFYSFRSKVVEWYEDRDPLDPTIMDILNMGALLPLPGRDEQGRKIVLVRACVHNPHSIKIDAVFKVMCMVVDFMCSRDETISATGVVAIIDLKGATLGHAVQLTPSFIRKAVNSWQDATPIRVKGMHHINVPYNSHVVFNIFKNFMKEKLRRRVHFHGGDAKKALAAVVPCKFLPTEYGGSGPSVTTLTAEVKERIVAHREWFIHPHQHGPLS